MKQQIEELIKEAEYRIKTYKNDQVFEGEKAKILSDAYIAETTYWLKHFRKMKSSVRTSSPA